MFPLIELYQNVNGLIQLYCPNPFFPFNRTILECKLKYRWREINSVTPLIELYQNVNTAIRARINRKS